MSLLKVASGLLSSNVSIIQPHNEHSPDFQTIYPEKEAKNMKHMYVYIYIENNMYVSSNGTCTISQSLLLDPVEVVFCAFRVQMMDLQHFSTFDITKENR